MQSLINNKYFSLVALTASVVLLFSFLFLTEPPQTNFLLTLIPLVLLWVIVYSLIMSMRIVLTQINKNIFRTAAISVASGIVMLTMFSALGQLSLFDGFLLVSLTALSAFYIRRSWKK